MADLTGGLTTDRISAALVGPEGRPLRDRRRVAADRGARADRRRGRRGPDRRGAPDRDGRRPPTASCSGAAWSTCLDIAGPDAGLVTGAMNTAGQVGAVLSPIILPYFLPKGAEDWATPLYIAGALYIAGSACWLFIDPRRPIAADPDTEVRSVDTPDDAR